MAKHILSVLTENKAGVLSRISGLFSRRGFNIDSLAVGPTEDESVSRMTIVVDGDEYIVEQVSKQLNKLIDVIKIKRLDESETVSRELALIKVNAPAEQRSEILQIVDIFRAKIIDVSHETLTVEMTGTTEKQKAILDLLAPYGIKELVKTGLVSLQRGTNYINK
ncbi:MAG: acetolactate synthase small subunit [Eubacteriales bacterium]|nr:acetolactate synthase small subunit [Eubacteriales bacterium]